MLRTPTTDPPAADPAARVCKSIDRLTGSLEIAAADISKRLAELTAAVERQADPKPADVPGPPHLTLETAADLSELRRALARRLLEVAG